MTPAAALAALEAAAVPGKAVEMAACHKAPRRYLGTPVPAIDALVKDWRRDLGGEAALALAAGLWDSDVHEARIAAARLLDRKRIEPEAAVWRQLAGWVPDFDAWAIADHVAIAAHKRLAGRPDRLDEIEPWIRSPHLWTRRAALVFTLPFARAEGRAGAGARARILGWAEACVDDQEWFIQKAVAWWLRELSKRHPREAADFLARNGIRMKAFARREAGKYLTQRQPESPRPR